MNYKCDKCLEQDKREAPRGWKLFKLLAVGLWRKHILRRKPVESKPGVKTYHLPRFYCLTCEKFVDFVVPLASEDLSIPAVVACHGKTTYHKVTLVALMMQFMCHISVFGEGWRRRDDGIPPNILQTMKEVEIALNG